MKKHLYYFTMLLIFLSSCDKEKYDQQGEFTLKGYVITAPSNTPLSGVLVRVENDAVTLASTKTSDTGFFMISVDREQLNSLCYISFTDTKMNITKNMEIVGVGLTEYDYGYISLYDSRNPNNLPVFQSLGYTYIVHPLLPEKYSQSDAKTICSELEEFGRNDWFLPSSTELIGYIESLNFTELKEFHNGYYWTSDALVHKDSDGYGYSNYIDPYLDNKYYVIPMSRYK